MICKKITASGNAIVPFITGTRIRVIRLVAGSDAATAILYDAATAAGTEFIKLSANAALGVDAEYLDISLSIGLSVTLSGTSPLLYVYYE